MHGGQKQEHTARQQCERKGNKRSLYEEQTEKSRVGRGGTRTLLLHVVAAAADGAGTEATASAAGVRAARAVAAVHAPLAAGKRLRAGIGSCSQVEAAVASCAVAVAATGGWRGADVAVWPGKSVELGGIQPLLLPPPVLPDRLPPPASLSVRRLLGLQVS